MRHARQVIMTMLGIALAVYALVCAGMATREQAMQCCDSMPCSSQSNHGQDCCKTMPAMHAPFVKPASMPAFASLISVQPALVPVIRSVIRPDFSEVHGFSAHS